MSVSGFRPAPPQDEPRAVDRAPQRSRTRAAPKTRRSLRKEIEQLVTLLNMPLVMAAPQDALDAIEQGALVNALDEQAKASARFHKALESLLSVTAGGSLPLVAGVIVARRAARHGAFGANLGSFVDGMGGQVLAMTNAKPSEMAETMEQVAAMFSSAKGGSNDGATGNGAADSGPAGAL